MDCSRRRTLQKSQPGEPPRTGTELRAEAQNPCTPSHPRHHSRHQLFAHPLPAGGQDRYRLPWLGLHPLAGTRLPSSLQMGQEKAQDLVLLGVPRAESGWFHLTSPQSSKCTGKLGGLLPASPQLSLRTGQSFLQGTVPLRR